VLDWDPARRKASLALEATDGDRDQEFVLIRSPENLGFCAGNNVGMRWAFANGADYVLVLNNDTLVSPDFLEHMVEVAESNESVGLVGGVITYCSDPDTVWWAGGSFNRYLIAKRIHEGESVSVVPAPEPFETEWISGCMMMIPSWVYSELGGFDEDYFIWSEEWDYSIRVAKAGHKLIVSPEARICHRIGRSLGIMKPLNYYYGIRNGLLFQRRHLPAYLWYPFFCYYLVNRVVRYAQLYLLGRGDLVRAGLDAIVDFMKGKTGKWAKQR
jgi:GT2 family glycosyltransferase